jgi:hypothetical protein
LAACAKPSGPTDGKPVAISPLQSENSEKKTKDPQTAEVSKPAAWESKLPKALSTFVPLEMAKGFEIGLYKGTYKQDRCDSGVVFSTTVEGTKITKSYTLYDDKECKKIIETAESTYKVVAASKETIDLVHEKETKTLFRETDLDLANDPTNPMCAAGWPEVGKSRNITNVGTCKLEAPLFTILVLIGDTLRWGTVSTQANAKIMDGSSAEKRHVLVEDLPYTKVVK